MYPDSVLHWIDDAEVPASSGATFEKRCPIDDACITQVARGTAADVDAAVAAAARAADAWSALPAPKRGEVLGRVASLMRAREQEVGEIGQKAKGETWKNEMW